MRAIGRAGIGWIGRRASAGLEVMVWRAMRAVGWLRPRAPRLAQLLRRSVLLVWWTLTGQLIRQARAFLHARRMRAAVPPPASAVPELVTDVDAAALVVPGSDMPEVSIIIPTYGQTGHTLRCLASLARHAPPLPIEVIVVDDAWPGQEVAMLMQVRGIRLLRNATNLGFIGSANAGAGAARGRFLMFLNNDTQVLAGWLEPMLALFRTHADVGAVGAKLLYPDGRLQEAGGIIWRDGSGWNYGRLDDPDRPVYNHVREVDYCSAAALLVRADAFRRLGGFDPRYAPAYFEDADLAFRLRAIGLRTLYQPLARVVHHEGATHGTDPAAGGKAHQARNRVRFVQAWDAVLARDHFANGRNVLRARDRACHRRIVLVIDHYVPQPDRDAGSRTMMAFIDALLGDGAVVKFWPHNLCHLPGYTEALQQRGVEVFHGPGHPGLSDWLRQNGDQIDAVLLSRPQVAEDVLPALRAHTRARISYYGHDLHFRRMRQQGELLRDEALLRAADRMEERERAIWRAVDGVLYPSEEEAAMVRAMAPETDARAVQPYGFAAVADPRAAPSDPLLLFVGGFGHPPNEEAACWFTAEVLPLIRAVQPSARLAIVGSTPTARVRALAGEAVSIHADVSDAELADWYGRARLAVVPLRFGAGVKLKVVEAMAQGVPVVTTPVGAQGLPGLAAVVPVTSDAVVFAERAVTLLRDDAAWAAQAAAQASYAGARFSLDALAASLRAAMAAPQPAQYPVSVA